MKHTIKLLAAGLVAATAVAFSSCDDDESLPKIDGYNNSNEVAKDNLVAHWTFDNTNNEVISSTAPSNTFGTVGFTDGQIGKALQLTKGALVYPTITAINSANALNNFTVSMWVNVANKKRTADDGFTTFFSLAPTGVSDVWGDIVAGAETGWHLPSSDTLVLKGLLNTHRPGGGNSLQDNVAVKNGTKGADFLGAKEWAHFVLSWNSTEGNFYLYANGEDVGGYTARGATPSEVGPLIMAVPVQAIFGSNPNSEIGFSAAGARPSWNPMANAMIDDVRIYNGNLTLAEIAALYNLGVAGR